jgi:hypothetical protein
MGTNSNPKGEGTNVAVPLGKSPASTNAWLGISDYVAQGTTGSRPDISARYGGDVIDGQLFKGNSVATDNKQLNSGGGEKQSAGTGQYGPGNPDYAVGGVGSREAMPKYGKGPTPQGKYVGAGVNATPQVGKPEGQVLRDMPFQPGMPVVAGSDEAKNRNMPRAQRGIGKPGKSGARM